MLAWILGLAVWGATHHAPSEAGIEPPRLEVFVQAPDPRDTAAPEDGGEDAGPPGDVAVLLQLDIDPDGHVSATEVVESGGPAFDAAARTAALAFEFLPAREGGQPIPVQILYRYVFPAPEPAPAPDRTNDPPAPPRPSPPPPPPAAETSPAGETVDPPAAAETPNVVDDVGVVRAPRIPPEASAVRLDGGALGTTPGTQGDPARALLTLGGLAQPPLGGAEPVVLGASPADTRVYVDWVPVPRLLHLGGHRTILPEAALESVTLVPGGASVPYGRAIGGRITLHTDLVRGPVRPRPVGGFVRIDPIDVGVGLDGRASARFAVGGAFRRSLVTQTYGGLAPTQVRDQIALPDSWDVQAKARWRVGEHHVEVLVLGVDDRVRRTRPGQTPDTMYQEVAEAAFYRVGVHTERLHPGGAVSTLAVWGGIDRNRWVGVWDDVSVDATDRSWWLGFRAGLRRRLGRWVLVRGGLDLEVRRSWFHKRGAVTLPAREGDIAVFGQRPGDRIGEDTWRHVLAGLGAWTGIVLGPSGERWAIEPQVRVEPLVVEGARSLPVRPVEPEVGSGTVHLTVAPRLRLAWSPVERVRLWAASGLYHQPPDPADLSPVFGNPHLLPPRAVHVLAGLAVRILPGWDVEASGFWVRSDRLAARADGPTPAVAQSLVSTGQGRNVGALLRSTYRLRRAVFVRLAYSWMRAQRKDPGPGSWRLFDGDQTHVLQLAAGWEPGKGWEIGGRLAFTSGLPQTAVVGAVSNADTGGYEPRFGDHNADRLPPFFELSLRLGWHTQGRWGRVAAWVDVQNLTNRVNVTQWVYTSDFAARGALRGLPIFPVIGLEFRT